MVVGKTRMRWFGAFVLAVFGLPAGASTTSGGVFYDCDITRSKDQSFWISGKIGIVVLNDGKIVVTDGVTLTYGVPVVYAKAERNTESDLAISWLLEGGLRANDVIFPQVSYRAKLSKDTNKIRVSGEVRGIRKVMRGRGTCTARIE